MLIKIKTNNIKRLFSHFLLKFSSLVKKHISSGKVTANDSNECPEVKKSGYISINC